MGKKSKEYSNVPTGRPRGRPRKDITIQLTPKQEEIKKLMDTKRFIFICAGRRFGKTTFSSVMLRDIAINNPNKILWYVAPTLKNAKELMWLKILNIIPKPYIKKVHTHDGVIFFRNGSQICIKGSDREDNLRGHGIDFVVLEEFAFHKAGVWELIIRPQLADRKGKALFIGTPSMKKGVHYRQLHDYAKSGKNPEWAYIHNTIYDNPHISREEIEEIKKSTGESAWKQEYLAEFIETEGVVYYEFNEVRDVYSPNISFPDIESYPGVCGIDWGISDDTAAVWLHINKDGQIIVTDEHLQNNWTPVQQAFAIKKKNEAHRTNFFILDKTAFKREGISDSETMKFNSVAKTFRENGLPVIPSEFHKGDAISIVKGFFRGDGESSWIKISSKCVNLIRGIKEWQYGNHEPDVVSAFRYGLTFIWKKKLTPLAEKINVMATEAKYNIINEQLKYSPNTIIKKRQNTYTDLKWNYELGVPE